MVVITVSEKETKFKDEVTLRIWDELVDIIEQNGISVYFLKDSKQINDGIKQIVDKLYDFVSDVKQDKRLIELYHEGKKMDKLITKECDEK